MVTKKTKPKRQPRNADPLQQLHKEMENNLRGIRQHKIQIEELAKATIDELKRLHDLSKKVSKIQPKKGQNKATTSHNNNHKFELDYELTNLKMIKKILALSTPFEVNQNIPKKKAKPREKQAVPKKEKKLKKNGQKTSDAAKILIVEDDRTTIKIVTHILEQHNFIVGSATEAEDGLKKAFKAKPNLILLDIMLPGMDGFQLLAKLQASEEMSQIPVIILSSLSGEKDILKGLEKGATDYVLKPFSPQILLFKIKKILSLKNEYLASDRHV